MNGKMTRNPLRRRVPSWTFRVQSPPWVQFFSHVAISGVQPSISEESRARGTTVRATFRQTYDGRRSRTPHSAYPPLRFVIDVGSRHALVSNTNCALILASSSQNGHNNCTYFGKFSHGLKLYNSTETLADTVTHAQAVQIRKDTEGECSTCTNPRPVHSIQPTKVHKGLCKPARIPNQHTASFSLH